VSIWPVREGFHPARTGLLNRAAARNGECVDLLVLGGTRFLGPAVIEAGLARGWQVTAAARGRSGSPPAGAEFVVVDREADPGLAALAGRTFDLVVDTWSGAPKILNENAASLRGRVGAYAYVSTRSVYAQPLLPGADEHAPVVDADAAAGSTNYPADKRGAELAVVQHFPAAHLLLRAGLVLGPREDIGRLPWWLRRIAQGGDVLSPGPQDLALQYIDVRDLAAFALDAAAAGRTGPYNTVSEPGHTTMGALLETCRTVTGSDARLRWADPAVILDAGIAPWSELPIWLPPDGEDYGLHQGDTSLALAHGLRCRPMQETVADTWSWLCAAGPEAGRGVLGRQVGLAAESERQVLASLGSGASG
jgi:2'-hydroxyisoflavone reductase